MSSRTKSGCITCRIRRVKCDETKPQCKKCQTSKRVCDGYLPEENFIPRRRLVETVRNLSVIGPVSRALTRSPSSRNPASEPVSPRDTVYFDLFRHSTVASTCSLFPSSFWQESFMRMAHSEPAIWHASVALGTLHQRAEALALKQDISVLSRHAAAHYGKAMTLASDLDSAPTVMALSIGLVAAASMLERFSDMQTHILGSLKILAQQNANDPHIQALRGTLMRLDLLAMTFVEASSPYPYGETTLAFSADRFLTSPLSREYSFDEMSSELFGLSRTLFILDDGVLKGNISYGPWMTKFDAFLRRLAVWERRMAQHEAINTALNDSEQTAGLALRLYHVVIRVLIRSTMLGGREERYDSLLGLFNYALQLATRIKERTHTANVISLSLEPGVIAPLFMIIHRCRHHKLRHAALKVLMEFKRVEGMWHSDSAARLIGALVAVEEESISFGNAEFFTPLPLNTSLPSIPWNAWSQPNFDIPTTLSWLEVPVIPEEKRVKDILGTGRLFDGKADLLLMMCPTNDVDQYGPAREVTVYF